MGEGKRKFVQLFTAILQNSYFKGFAEGKIYKGSSKSICVPGLNCYSCPGALGSCPLGALQAVIGSAKYQFSFYIVGMLLLFGGLLGRFICGWICPFGLIQELFYKLPTEKCKADYKIKKLGFLKYVFLVFFVILGPLLFLNAANQGTPYFCKLVCPVGALEGGIPLVFMNDSLQGAIGLLFYWKIFLLGFVIFLSIVIFRPFCRLVCPLGAIYGLFNKVSLYQLRMNDAKCTGCAACQSVCPMNCSPYQNPSDAECIRCGRCKAECPHGAIEMGFGIGLQSKEKIV